MAKKTKKRTERRREKEKPWTLTDFVTSVDQAMQTQAREHPAVRQTHARLSPEWKEVSTLALQLLAAHDTAERTRLTEALVAQGEYATRVLIELLLGLKQRGEEG